MTEVFAQWMPYVYTAVLDVWFRVRYDFISALPFIR